MNYDYYKKIKIKIPLRALGQAQFDSQNWIKPANGPTTLD